MLRNHFTLDASVPRSRPLRALLDCWYYLRAHPAYTWADVLGTWPPPPWTRDLDAYLERLAAEGARERAHWAALKAGTVA